MCSDSLAFSEVQGVVSEVRNHFQQFSEAKAQHTPKFGEHSLICGLVQYLLVILGAVNSMLCPA